MFLHVSVCPWGGGAFWARSRGEVGGSGQGGCPDPCPGLRLGGWLGVSRPTPRGVGCPGQHLGGPGGMGVCPGPGQGSVSQHALRQTPHQQTATSVGGTHPTGMHSCSNLQLLDVTTDPTNHSQQRGSLN